MSADQLLLWMSARKEGSWAQFRGAVNSIFTSKDGDDLTMSSLPLHQLLRLNLQRLGHVEFFNGDTALRWRVAPPVLVLQRREAGWCGIAAGARYPDLAKRLELAGVQLDVTRMQGAPDLMLARMTSALALQRAAEGVGMHVQLDAPAAILGSVPPIDATHFRVAAPLPRGTNWSIARFNAQSLAWHSATRQDAVNAGRQELLRFESGYERHYFLCTRDGGFRVPAQAGKFLLLRHEHKKVLRYDSRRECLSLPSVCRPPMLVERALYLCSGMPAAFEALDGRGMVHYNCVPMSIAISTASLLRQELRA